MNSFGRSTNTMALHVRRILTDRSLSGLAATLCASVAVSASVSSRPPAPACAYSRPRQNLQQEQDRKHHRPDMGTEKGQTLTDEEIPPALRSHPYRHFITSWKSKEELATHLLENMVHNSDGVFAFNKPYGVGISNVQEVKQYKSEMAERQGKTIWHDSPKVKEPPPPAWDSLYHARGVTLSPYTLLDTLPILRSKLGMPSLTFCRSTEKFSSGIAVFAETEKVEERLKFLYKGAKMSSVKNLFYIVVSALTPELDDNCLKETVGLSIQEQEFKGRKLTLPIVERKFSSKRLKNRLITPVQAEVQLMSRSPGSSSALVEIQTTVTKQYFLRVYANDLLMPILGDHLFSNRIQSMVCVPVAVNPLSVEPGTTTQVLPPKVLRSLRLGEAKDAIIVPLHAHHYKYIIPHFFGKWKHKEITAPPSKYFQWTCSQLKLDLDDTIWKPTNQSAGPK